MSGFRIIIFRDRNTSRERIAFEPIAKVKFEQQMFSGSFYQIDTAFNETTPNDNFVFDNDDIGSIFEGWIANTNKFVSQWKEINFARSLISAFSQNGLSKTVNLFRGEFAGTVLNKKGDKLEGFTDHTSIHTLFHYQDKNVFICATNIQYITQALKSLNISYALNELGAYYMLTYGFMLEKATIIENIYKLKPGTFFSFDITHWNLFIDSYYRIDNMKESKLPYNEILERLHILFEQSVKYGIDKDQKAGKVSTFHLSDGLDCRTTLLAAEELDCKEKLILNYASPASTDYLYPQEIDKTISGNLLQLPLDGTYLIRHWEDWFDATGGIIHNSPGAGPLFDMLPMIDWSRYGLSHNGHLGDVVLGTYHGKGKHTSVDYKSGSLSQLLFDRIAGECFELTKQYPNNEIFKFYSRGANNIVEGSIYHRLFTHSSSPFMEPDFFDFSLSIPPRIRFGGRLRVDLINRYYPFAKHTRWGKTKMRIDTSTTLLGMFPKFAQFYALPAQIIKAFNKFVLRNDSYGLIPVDYWYRTSKELRLFYDNLFQENISLLHSYPNLKKDCSLLYHSQVLYRQTEQRVYNKILAVSLLYTVKKYFG